MQEEIITLEQFKKKMEWHNKEEIIEMLYDQSLKTINISIKLTEILAQL